MCAAAHLVLAGALESGLQSGHVSLHLLACLSANHQRYEQSADPVPLEIELDRHTGLCAVERLNGDVYGRPDRPIDAVDGPGPRRADLVTSEFTRRSRPPMRRVVVHLEPTLGRSPPSMYPSTMFSCHSVNRLGSVTYEKTSAGEPAISTCDTIAPTGVPPVQRLSMACNGTVVPFRKTRTLSVSRQSS
jgi:hypothetical protein